MSTRAASGTHVFVTPELDGAPTGGTLYNAQLIAGLRASGIRCEHVTLAGAAALARGTEQRLWVDSLYLDALPALRADHPGQPLFLIVHYLPSLVAQGRELTWDELAANERDAISAADGFLVTSEFMRGQFARFALGTRAVLCVEPGTDGAPARTTRSAEDGDATRGLMLCNVVEPKGVLGLLAALAQQTRGGDRFSLDIAGRVDLEPDYVQACRRLIADSSALRERVALCGALPHAQALAQLAACDVLLSASRMESYGMALAEARAAGVPIIARRGGHAHALVAPGAGGRLVDDEAAVATSFLGLVRGPALLRERQRAAVRNVRARDWPQAAAEFLAQVQTLAS